MLDRTRAPALNDLAQRIEAEQVEMQMHEPDRLPDPPPSTEKPTCADCGRNWIERPAAMFHGHIWKAMGMGPHQWLCAYCANRRLFTVCAFNDNEGSDHVHRTVQGDCREHRPAHPQN